MKNAYPLSFVTISCIQIFGIITGLEILCTITKPMMMPLLALWLMAETRGISSKLRSGWLLGLGFSTLGDVLLMGKGNLFFILGLSAFLLAHVSYIGGISSGLKDRRGFLVEKPLWALPFVTFPVLFLFWLWGDIPVAMRFPVAVYAIVIATMAQSVVNLHGHIPGKIFWTMMGGALLFVLSDSLIALNKFGHPFEGGRLAVMATYIVGQWLLAKGVISLLNLPHPSDAVSTK